MSVRGKAAIAGFGELKSMRAYPPERTTLGVLADAAAQAIADAGVRKSEVDGLIVEGAGAQTGGWPAIVAEYLGIHPTFASGVNMMGATASTAVAQAAAYINAGYATTVLIALGGARGGAEGGGPAAPGGPVEPWTAPYGPVVAANGWYALVAQRHAFEYGTTDEQRFKVAVDQRFNAQANPLAVFYGQPSTMEDIRNSRLVADPLHLLECVMPCSGATAMIVTTPERASTLRHKPVYIMGIGQYIDHDTLTHAARATRSPAVVSARRAFEMSGLGPKDMNMAQIYDCYTITVMATMEDAGFIPKGEAGPWYMEHDTTYKGPLPVNTNGGQLSVGQHGGAPFAQVVEGARQLMGRAGERQVPNAVTCFVNG